MVYCLFYIPDIHRSYGHHFRHYIVRTRKLHYHAESDEDTYINMTNHAYFNLGGQDSGSILDHVMQLNASNFTPVQDGKSIPTGEIRSVAGTPMDFTSPKAIGKDIDAEVRR